MVSAGCAVTDDWTAIELRTGSLKARFTQSTRTVTMFGVQSHPDAEFMGTMIDGMNAITSILDNWRNRVF